MGIVKEEHIISTLSVSSDYSSEPHRVRPHSRATSSAAVPRRNLHVHNSRLSRCRLALDSALTNKTYGAKLVEITVLRPIRLPRNPLAVSHPRHPRHPRHLRHLRPLPGGHDERDGMCQVPWSVDRGNLRLYVHPISCKLFVSELSGPK